VQIAAAPSDLFLLAILGAAEAAPQGETSPSKYLFYLFFFI